MPSCPECKKKLPKDTMSFRPFCSERCKMLDLLKWMNGDYAIPAEDDGDFPPLHVKEEEDMRR